MMVLPSNSRIVVPSGPKLFCIYMIIPPPPPPTDNRYDTFRYTYINIRNHLIQLYKAPRNFRRTAITQADRVNPVSATPANGRLG